MAATSWLRYATARAAPERGRWSGWPNGFAPVLGGGRFTQPGADGGDTRDRR